jgi:calmodulin
MSRFDPETEAQLRDAFNAGSNGITLCHFPIFIGFLMKLFSGTGSVTWQGLAAVLRYLGQNPSPTEAQNIMSQHGSGGTMDSGAFMNMMAKRYKTAEGEEELIEAFRVFDKDGTGAIASGELRHLLTNLGERLEPELVNGMMQEVIPGAAGNLKYEPFIRYVMNL